MANPTVKSLAGDVATLQEGMAAILAAVSGGGATEDADATEDTGKGKRSSRATRTAAKAKAIRRNLDPFVVECGELTFTVAPSSQSKNGNGVLYRRGARVMANTGRSFTEDEVAALIKHGDAVMGAVEDVNERALIGAFLPDGEEA